jgi:hypothetical protein
MSVTIVCVLLVLGAAGLPLRAQQTFWHEYEARVAASEAEQPHWPTPLVTPTPRLDQDIKWDFLRQRSASGFDTWNLGNSRGLDVLPLRSIQLSFNLPPFLDHTVPGKKDGFGDVTFTLRYRVFARNEAKGNRILTAFLGASLPTGKNGNGSCCAIVTPGLGGGKGWGRLALMGYAGASLPVSNSAGLGHTITLHSTAEYSIGASGTLHRITPQFESNSSIYIGGPNDGDAQSFLTPGLIFGRFPFSRARLAEGKVATGVTFAVGEQIAVTRFHTYNHALVLAFRLPL